MNNKKALFRQFFIFFAACLFCPNIIYSESIQDLGNPFLDLTAKPGIVVPLLKDSDLFYPGAGCILSGGIKIPGLPYLFAYELYDIEYKDVQLIKALQSLNAYEVLIPFAPELVEYLPEKLLMRTYTSRLLDYIASSCILHQHQRDKTDDNKNIVDLDCEGFIFPINISFRNNSLYGFTNFIDRSRSMIFF